MSTNHTTNYGLCQWEPGDKVLRADFNADNARLETALSDLEERVALLDRAAVNLAYYTGLFGLADFAARGKVLPSQSMTYNDFQYSEGTCAGGAKFDNGVLTLEGTGTTGTFTSLNIGVDSGKWTRALLWVHYSQAGGTVTPSINGAPMKLERFRTTYSPGKNKECFERSFLYEGSGTSVVQISLDLKCGDKGKLEVYDYCAFFL